MDDATTNPALVERFGEQPPDIAGELRSMLKLYDVDAQELFFKWESYSMKMGPEDTKLTLDTVRAFKKDVHEQLEREVRGKARMMQQQQTPAAQRTVRPQAGGDAFALFDGMLPTTTTPGRASALKRKQVVHETPPRGKASRALLDPSSPVRTPTKNGTASSVEPVTPFGKRGNAGETIEVLNPHVQKPTLPLPGASYDSRVRFSFNMEIKNFDYRPMYQKLTEASETHDERIDEFAAAIQEHYSLPDEAFGDPSAASPSEIVAVGRIVSDAMDGRFNPSSVLLESSRMAGAGARTPLKLDKIQSFAFFPGQILAVKGVNSSGHYFQVYEVLEPPKLPPASSTTDNLADAAQRLSAGPLSIFISAGPYTTDDNLRFEALEELCNNAAEQQPDVVILSGPFIDSEHPLVQEGDFDLEGVDEMYDGTVEHLFREKISKQISKIKSSMVIIIPSLRDMVSKHLAFPQDRLNKKGLELPNNAKCLPNPSMFSLNELVFSVTTNDILFHLSREETSRKPAVANPQARFSSHMLNQRSFYPLFPPPNREGLPQGLGGVGAGLDVPHIRLADMVNVIPDVLVVPSILGTFAKVVEGVVTVNPGSASRRQGAGTWVEMTVAPKQVEGGGGGAVAHDVWERARVEVRRM